MLAIAVQNDPSPAIKAMREEGLLVVAAPVALRPTSAHRQPERTRRSSRNH